VRTLLISAGVVVAVVAVAVLAATMAIRALRKYVRSVWPHS
jgi:hypothetical protein